MRTISLPGVIALALGAWSFAGSALAQGCPPGYYYASDGRCYPGAPPVYPPPVYDYAPPVYQPPPVFDGFVLGIGLGALLGVLGSELGGDHHGGGDRGRQRNVPGDRRHR